MMLAVVLGSLVAAIVAGVVIMPAAALIPIIVGAIIANRLGYQDQGRAVAKAIGPLTQPAEDVAGKLGQLADLRDGGAITAEEYEAKKAELLARL